MLIWYKKMHKFSYEHNIEHKKSKLRALNPEMIGKNYLEPNYANLVIKNNKSYTNTNCGIIAVVMGIILSVIGKILSFALMHNG